MGLFVVLVQGLLRGFLDILDELLGLGYSGAFSRISSTISCTFSMTSRSFSFTAGLEHLIHLGSPGLACLSAGLCFTFGGLGIHIGVVVLALVKTR